MDIEKFTERARGFIQAAQTIAIREFHQQLTPEHLLKALLDDEEGAAAGLIRAAGGDDRPRGPRVEAELAKLPKVQGGGAGQPQITPPLVRVLDARPAGRDKGRRRICGAGPPAGGARRQRQAAAARALRNAGVTAQALEKAVADIRKGRKVDQPERRGELRRAEEICPRRHRAGARRQARPGDRPRRGNPPHHPGAGAPHQEQPGADRRARRRARPPSSRAWRSASSTATCRRR